MNYKKIILFLIGIFILLPSTVLADMSGATVLLGIMLLIPIVVVISIIIILFHNFLISYIILKFYYKKQIKNKFDFFIFILKYSFFVGLVELFLLPILLISLINVYLSAAVYSILSGIAIFFIFRLFFPKYINMEKEQVNNLSFLMSILTNPAIGLILIFYILPLTFISMFQSFIH